MFVIVAVVALGLLASDLIRRARWRRALETAWQKENAEFLLHLRESR